MLLGVVVLLAGALLGFSCSGGDGAVAKEGDTVKVHYTGSLDDGTVFDSSVNRDPFQFTVGAGQVIAGFDEAVLGMQVGQSRTVVIPAAEAYGPYREDLLITLTREEFPLDKEPVLGQRMSAYLDSGQQVVAEVIDVTETSVTLDANHHLAGEDLTFEIELVAIN